MKQVTMADMKLTWLLFKINLPEICLIDVDIFGSSKMMPLSLTPLNCNVAPNKESSKLPKNAQNVAIAIHQYWDVDDSINCSKLLYWSLFTCCNDRNVQK